MKKTMMVEVVFFQNVRKTPPSKGYRPHFVIDGNENYFGIVFTDLDAIALGTKTIAEVALGMFDIDYSPFTIGAKFTVREGAIIVGQGVVLDLKKHP